MLTKRLQRLVDVIPKSDVLADVGCDHGYVGIEALKRGVARKVIFVDISSQCLQKARTNCPTALQDNASFVCQDGLWQTDCDTAVICGMGGLEILSVLNAAQRLPKAVVLQPMRNIVDTRKYVSRHYKIALDETFFDGKYYTVIAGVERGNYDCNLDELELNFGVTNIRQPSEDFVAYLQNEHNKLQQIQQQLLLNSDSDEITRKLKLVEQALAVALGK